MLSGSVLTHRAALWERKVTFLLRMCSGSQAALFLSDLVRSPSSPGKSFESRHGMEAAHVGVLLYKTRTDPGIGTRRATVIRRISKQELHRSPKYLLPSLHIWPPGSLNNLLIIVILAPLGTLHNKHNDLKIFLLFSRVNAGL
ncbi:uncharacterized protein LOC119505353 isoform X8 [Choloepus didactylus]|uniref:uncharacterized protein LOC119505353 isoform X8 n=1 Tax=Choloepus didactylus TaxID=27675 RepID=UPI0018A08F07|nr:uncharacterized protein LOC119505353 isoform X8 [Choloepus didactylus]